MGGVCQRGVLEDVEQEQNRRSGASVAELTHEELNKVGDIFKPKEWATAEGGRATILGSIKVCKSIAGKVRNLAYGVRKVEVRRDDGASLEESRLFLEPWNWDTGMSAPYDKPPSVKCR